MEIGDFQLITEKHKAAVFYFSTPDCNVCKVLKPKLIELLETDFPEIHFYYINLEEDKNLAGQLNIFTVPTIIFYFDGKEFLRKSRFINLVELSGEIERIYRIMFQ
jgi:thioredoxin 1